MRCIASLLLLAALGAGEPMKRPAPHTEGDAYEREVIEVVESAWTEDFAFWSRKVTRSMLYHDDVLAGGRVKRRWVVKQRETVVTKNGKRERGARESGLPEQNPQMLDSGRTVWDDALMRKALKKGLEWQADVKPGRLRVRIVGPAKFMETATWRALVDWYRKDGILKGEAHLDRGSHRLLALKLQGTLRHKTKRGTELHKTTFGIKTRLRPPQAPAPAHSIAARQEPGERSQVDLRFASVARVGDGKVRDLLQVRYVEEVKAVTKDAARWTRTFDVHQRLRVTEIKGLAPRRKVVRSELAGKTIAFQRGGMGAGHDAPADLARHELCGVVLDAGFELLLPDRAVHKGDHWTIAAERARALPLPAGAWKATLAEITPQEAVVEVTMTGERWRAEGKLRFDRAAGKVVHVRLYLAPADAGLGGDLQRTIWLEVTRKMDP